MELLELQVQDNMQTVVEILPLDMNGKFLATSLEFDQQQGSRFVRNLKPCPYITLRLLETAGLKQATSARERHMLNILSYLSAPLRTSRVIIDRSQTIK